MRLFASAISTSAISDHLPARPVAPQPATVVVTLEAALLTASDPHPLVVKTYLSELNRIAVDEVMRRRNGQRTAIAVRLVPAQQVRESVVRAGALGDRMLGELLLRRVQDAGITTREGIGRTLRVTVRRGTVT